MAIRIDGQGPRVPEGPQPVRLLRIESGYSIKFRMLSESIGGCFTHYVQKRSRYCPGDDAGCTFHKAEATWKGYVAAEQYRESSDDWMPVVLELTEHAELDMRDIYQRGQIWLLSRPAEKRGKRAPVVASLIDTGDLTSTPPAFNIFGVLYHVYHVQTMELNVRNPLPPRLVMRPTPANGRIGANGVTK